VTDTQRIQDQIDRLALDLPRRLPPELRQIFLTHYPGEKYGQLTEANYLNAWEAFATRMETGGFFEMIRRAAVRPMPASFIDEIEHKRQRQQEARRAHVKRALQEHPLTRLRDAGVLIIEACDQIAAEGGCIDEWHW